MKMNAYEVEHYRAALAAAGDLKKLQEMYTTKYPEIQDLNTQGFWNTILHNRVPLSSQDGMTQDRTKYTARLVPKDAHKILDIGIGPGWIEEFLEKRAHELDLHGIDISDDTIKQLKTRFPMWKNNFKNQSLYKMPFNEPFDAILLLEVLEHIPPSKTFGLLNQIYKLLKPNGSFILSVPTNEGLEFMADNPSGHVRMYTEPLIRAELELAGFNVLTLKTFNAFPTLYRLKKLLSSTVLRKHWKPNNFVIHARKT